MRSSDPSCLFCKIIAGEIPSPRVYEDSEFIAIRDIRPQAQTHLLVMPKAHIASLESAFPESGEADAKLVGKLFQAGTNIARGNGLLPGGFRAVINTGQDGGQTVFHLHLHILGGKKLENHFG